MSPAVARLIALDDANVAAGVAWHAAPSDARDAAWWQATLDVVDARCALTPEERAEYAALRPQVTL